MFRIVLPVVVVLTLGTLFTVPRPAVAQPPAAPKDEATPEKVRQAIDKGVRFLEKQQNPQGNWESILLDFALDMEGGTTALATLALLNCGVKATEKSVRGGLEYLDKLPPKKTYVVGLQTMALAETREPKYLPRIQQNVAWLVDTAIGLKGGNLQGWSYPGNTIADNSNTQYALLGLYAAKQAGATIDDGVWKAIQSFYDRSQVKPTPTTGFWTYASTPVAGGGVFGDASGSFTMTVAGVCGLIIAGMGLNQSEQDLDPNTGVAKNCGVYAENTALARGMNWIVSKFHNYTEGKDTLDKFVQGKSTMYNVYGLERLGRLSGQRFIGRHDWYRDGCEFLLRAQDATGAFSAGRNIDGPNVVSSSFALLFLSKGRTPVLVTKFAWGDFQDRGNGTFVEVGDPRPGVANWNRKHSDTRHVVEYASKELFKNTPLAWQVYDVRRQDLSSKEKILAEVGVLLQSPVVYLNGHGRLVLSDGQKEVLKKYVEEGGFLVGEACCGDPAFAKSFRELIKELFPNNALAKLPPEHAIWRAYTDVSPADFPDLEGLERGCRTVAVFSPSPLAGFWEESKFMPPVPKPGDPRQPAKNRGERAFRLVGNVIAYATGMELPKPKLTRAKLADAGTDKAPGRSQFKPIQLKLDGDAPAAPAGMRNLMSHMREAHRLDVAMESKPDAYQMFPGALELAAFKFLYMHGRKPLKFTPDDEINLKANLQTGGLLLADAGCNGLAAWKAFDTSFRDAMKRMFPDSPLQLIPPDDPLFTKMANSPIGNVRCRREKPDGTGPEAELKTVSPYLEGIKIDGRWVVIYSKYDIGCALEGHKAADCMGHDKDSALKIASAAVLYSLKR